MILADYKVATIGELVAEKFQRAEVFKKFGIDYCCGGKKTLVDVLQDRKEILEKVMGALDQLDNSISEELDFNLMDLDELCNYIVTKHHEYIRSSVPFLIDLSQKVARVHGHRNPQLLEIFKLYYRLAHELLTHLEKEERILFPFIKKSFQFPDEIENSSRLTQPVKVMESEHEGAGELLKSIRKATDDFELPDYACTSYRVLFAKLEEFEDDLHRHIHLENNILFPRALQLHHKSF